MRYYATQRPLAPGTFPKPQDNKVLSVTNYDERTYISALMKKAWGYVEYAKPLGSAEAEAYELVKDELKEERKDRICTLLGKILRETRALCDLDDLEYHAEDETVLATFAGGTKRINVEGDSGIAMIKDILNHIA